MKDIVQIRTNQSKLDIYKKYLLVKIVKKIIYKQFIIKIKE